MNLRYIPAEFGEFLTFIRMDSVMGYYEILALQLEVGRNFRPWVDYNAGGGYTWMLGNANMLQLNLLANFSWKSMARGRYIIQVPGQPVSEGSYFSRHSFIGLSAAYIFTGVNNRFRKAYEKMPMP